MMNKKDVALGFLTNVAQYTMFISPSITKEMSMHTTMQLNF